MKKLVLVMALVLGVGVIAFVARRRAMVKRQFKASQDSPTFVPPKNPKVPRWGDFALFGVVLVVTNEAQGSSIVILANDKDRAPSVPTEVLKGREVVQNTVYRCSKIQLGELYKAFTAAGLFEQSQEPLAAGKLGVEIVVSDGKRIYRVSKNPETIMAFDTAQAKIAELIATLKK